ncbi:MAG: two-component regulator propeller domain-containing protein [Anaerolineales bacterium]
MKQKFIRPLSIWLALLVASATLAGLPSLWQLRAHREPPPFEPPTGQIGSEAETAPSSASTPPIIRFGHLGPAEGLSQSMVTCILQDDQGFLWIGTQDGLNRYDGYTFRVFRPDPADPTSISDNWINTIFQDSQGYLWVGTNEGLNRYDPKTGQFRRFLNDPDNPESLINNTVQVVFEDSRGTLWVGTADGLDRFSPARNGFIHYYTETFLPPDISSNNITAIHEDVNGGLWIGTNGGGLNRYIRTLDGFLHYTHDPANRNSIISNSINAIVSDYNGTLWLATNRGLDHLDPRLEYAAHYRHYPAIAHSLASNNVLSLYIDRGGNLWVGTSEGLDRFERSTGRFIHYRHQPGNPYSLSASAASVIYEDRGGILWVGTFGGGLNRYDHGQDRFTLYDYQPDNPNSLSGNVVFPILVDSSGQVWVGTYGSGLNRFDPQTGLFTRYRHLPDDPNSLQNDEIWALHMDEDGLLWIGTSTGLDWLDPRTGQFTHYTPAEGDPRPLMSERIYVIHADRRGIYWLGTDTGLYKFNPRTRRVIARYIHQVTDPSSLSGNEIYSLYEDQDGTLWVGTASDGLNHFDPLSERAVRYQHRPGSPGSLSDDTVLTIYRDSRGTLWIGTGGGLNRYLPESDSFIYYLDTDGLPGNLIYGILEDAGGFLWLSTNYGLSRFDPRSETFRNYTVSDGLPSNEFNLNAYAMAPSGEMYFGGINGLTVFQPNNIQDSTYVPPVVLTSLTTDGQPLLADKASEALQEVTIAWPGRSFEFEFVALGFAQPGRNQYAYLLENFDEDWNYIGTQHSGRYTNLPGGTYTLHLMAANHDGIWNPVPTSIQITVVPPFWQTFWFRALAILLVLLIAISSNQVRIRAIDRRNRELERLVQERTSALLRRSEEMQALYQADEKMLRSLTLEDVFCALIDTACDILHADEGVILSWRPSPAGWYVRAARGLDPIPPSIPGNRSPADPLEQIASKSKPIILDLSTDRPKGQRGSISALLSERIRSAILLPISIGESRPAILLVGFRQREAVSADIQRLFQAMIQRAALSIENARLFEQAKELAVIEERNRLARDLHDSAKQKAFAALAQLGASGGLLNTNPASAGQHLREAETLVSEVIQELTFLIQEMYPLALEEKGLATSLREYVFEWENRNETTVDLKISNERHISPKIEQAIYRVIQEALANVARHSRASKVVIALDYLPESIEVSIQDNGCGFEPRQKTAGLGLRSIQERIERLNGTLRLVTAPHQGVRLEVRVPVEKNAEQEV